MAYSWQSDDHTLSFKCGYCGEGIASNVGYKQKYLSNSTGRYIRICPKCYQPTYIIEGSQVSQVPGVAYGENVKFLPDSINALYNEARECFGINAYTSVIMCCRKLLMHIAREEGAKEDLPFGQYVQYLKDNGYVTKPGQVWADSILKMGNIANHTLERYSKQDAELIMRFTEMMLKTIYETPGFHEQLNKKAGDK